MEKLSLTSFEESEKDLGDLFSRVQARLKRRPFFVEVLQKSAMNVLINDRHPKRESDFQYVSFPGFFFHSSALITQTDFVEINLLTHFRLKRVTHDIYLVII
jgi:hypothetical protein